MDGANNASKKLLRPNKATIHKPHSQQKGEAKGVKGVAKLFSLGSTVGIPEDAKYEALGASFGLEEVKSILGSDPKQRDEKSLQRVMEWLIKDAAQVGMEIAPELQVPQNILLQALRKSFVAAFSPGEYVYDQDEEIRYFCIVLSGRLRRRRLMKKQGNEAAEGAGDDGGEESHEGARKGMDCTIEFITRGEVLGMLLNSDKSASGIQAVVESQLLMISADDYAATIKPFHKDMASDAMEFMKDKGLVANPTQMVHQLIRLAPLLRSRKVQRGRFIATINQPQRHIWILRKGCCSLLLRKEDGSQETNSEKRIGLETPDPLTMLLQRDASPLESKAEELSNQTIAKHTRGPLRQMLQGHDGQLKGLEGRTKTGGGTEVALVATLNEPGTLLGEEVLLNDTMQGMAAARSYYSIRVEEDSSFYCLELTAFKKLSDILGQKAIAMKMQHKMDRRKESLQKNVKVLSKLNLNARTSVARELERMEDLSIGQSPSQAPGGGGRCGAPDGFHASLANRPMNSGLIAGGLLCIQNGNQKIQEMRRYGPGVEAVMANYRKQKDPHANQKSLGNLHSCDHANRSALANPLGGSVMAGCHFDKPPPPLKRISSVPSNLQLGSSNSMLGSSSGGLVFSTEVDVPMPYSIGNLSSEVVASSDQPPSPEPCDEYEEQSDEEKSHSKSLETQSKADHRRKRRIVSAFRRVVRSRSFVVLTDDSEVRSVLKKTFLSLRAELLFVKTAMELLHALSDPRQLHHVFLLDIAKPDLNVDGLLRTIRKTVRYQAAPVIAISMSRNLPDLVKSTCSYVVFKPPSPEIVREATVWCLDRGVLESHFRKEGTLGDPDALQQEQLSQKGEQNDEDTVGNNLRPEPQSRQSAESVQPVQAEIEVTDKALEKVNAQMGESEAGPEASLPTTSEEVGVEEGEPQEPEM